MSKPMPIAATRRAASMAGLSAFAFFAQGEATHVGGKLGMLGVGAHLEVAEVALAVVEGRVGKSADRADRRGDLAVAVGIARVGDGVFFEEFSGERIGVLAVDAEEGDPLAGLAVEGGERGGGAGEGRVVGVAPVFTAPGGAASDRRQGKRRDRRQAGRELSSLTSQFLDYNTDVRFAALASHVREPGGCER